MSITNQQTEQKFPCPAEKLYECALKAIDRTGFKLKERDDLLKRITATAGVSLFSWGENLVLAIEETDKDSSILRIESSTKFAAGGFENAYRHSKHFRTLIGDISRQLQAISQ